MSAPKKTTKATKSPTPATKETKAAKPAVKKSAAKASTPAARAASATATIVAAVTRAAAPAFVAPVAAPAPAVKEVVRTARPTTIAARIDVGFGNALYVRGEGAGLSWDSGVAMTNMGADLWQLNLGESDQPVTFKFLVNDLSWSVGPDFTVAAGVSATFTPEF